MVINTEGLTLFGPGSEWLWTMAQFLVLLITGLAIYRQLRAQGSANALTGQVALMNRWEAPEMVRLRAAALMHIASRQSGEPPTYALVGNFFAEMAALQTHGHVRVTDSWEVWSRQIQLWWALGAPWVPDWRRITPGVYGEFEKLALAMAELDRKNGVPNFDPATMKDLVESQIDRLILRLRLDHEAKQGFVPTWPIAKPASKSPAIAAIAEREGSDRTRPDAGAAVPT